MSLLIMPEGFALVSDAQVDIDRAIGTVDEETWSKYCTGEYGLDWTVENRIFVPITTEEELKMREFEPIRENERLIRYGEGDNMISKLNRLYRTGHVSEEEYNSRSNEIYNWMQAVNDTKKQSTYPLEVIYPTNPMI